MKKILLALLVIAAMASCKKSEVNPLNTVSLISGNMVIVTSSDTTFIMAIPAGEINVKGSDVRFVNMGYNTAEVTLNGRKLLIFQNEY